MLNENKLSGCHIVIYFLHLASTEIEGNHIFVLSKDSLLFYSEAKQNELFAL